MSGHIFGGPTPTSGGETHWYTTNSEYGKTVMQTKPTGGIPSYNRPSFYIAPRKLPVVDANAHAQNPIPGVLSERRAEADARKLLTTGPAKQFMQHEMGRFWENIQESTDSAGAARAAAMAPVVADTTRSDPAAPPPLPPVEAGAAGQEQVSAGHSDILTITRNGDEAVAEFKTRPDVDALSHSVPSTASSTGNATLAPPTGQVAPPVGQVVPPVGQVAPPNGEAAPAEQAKT